VFESERRSKRSAGAELHTKIVRGAQKKKKEKKKHREKGSARQGEKSRRRRGARRSGCVGEEEL
jgi:hypothetical protein